MNKILSFLKKIYIPKFFKTKKFLIFLFVFLSFWLFASLGVFQVTKKIEEVLNAKAKEGVQKFQKQTGLKIKWEMLDFDILKMTVHLEGVEFSAIEKFRSKQIQELRFLDGLQKIEKISARPSVFSLLFDKKIFLSKLKIQKGELYLKTLQVFEPRPLEKAKSFEFPVKKILVKDVNLTLRHKDRKLELSQIQSVISQKRSRNFSFNLFVKAFSIQKETEGIFDSTQGGWGVDKVFGLDLKGHFKPQKLSFFNIKVKNSSFESITKSLLVDFDHKGFHSFNLSSSGSLPLFLIKEIFSMIDKDIKLSNSYLSYDLNLKYNKQKGWLGKFNISSKDFLFRGEKLKSLDMRGRLKGWFLALDRGKVQIDSNRGFYIKKSELIFNKDPFLFNFSIQSQNLDFDFVSNTILEVDHFPVQGSFNGLIACQGQGRFENMKCDLKGDSPQVNITPKPNNHLLSINNFETLAKFTIDRESLSFELSATKGHSRIEADGEYLISSDELSLSYAGRGSLGEDVRFNLPFALNGFAEVKKSFIFIKKNQVSVSGQVESPFLEIEKYQLTNLKGSFRFLNNVLSFYDVKGSPGQTSHSSEMTIDFNKKNLNLKLSSDFFDFTDFLKTVKAYVQLPFSLSGSGSIAFSMDYPWENPEARGFDLKGNFFNVVIEKDFFKQAEFHLSLKNKKGFVHSLSLRRSKGLLKSSGFFDTNHSLNLDILIQKIPLEGFSLLNRLFPFNQVGLIDGNIKVVGALNNPKAEGELVVSNTFIYSYPVGDSKLKVKINKDLFSFSGKVIDKIQMDHFSYMFSQKQKIKLKGNVFDFDFITLLFSKDRKNKTVDYRSQVEGTFDLEREEFWKGNVFVKTATIFRANKWLKNKNSFKLDLQKDKWLLSPVHFFDNENKTFGFKSKNKNYLVLKGSADLGFFSVFFPFLTDFEGDIKGEVLIHNNLKDMKPKGSFQVENTLFAIPFLPDFNDSKANLIFSNDNLYINNFSSMAGGGAVSGFGSIGYQFNKPLNVDLNLEFNKAHLQIPKGFNTKGSGKIRIKGSKAPYLIDGEYNIESGEIIKEFSAVDETEYDFALLKEDKKSAPSLFSLDLKLKTDSPVSVNSSLIRSFIKGEAMIYGLFDSLLMKGQFELAEGLGQNLIFFRGQEFKVSSGSIAFFNSSPKKPYLDISANTLFKERVIDPLESQEETEKEYTIFLQVKGLADSLDFSLKSFPLLNEKEIISLLTLGISSRRFDSNLKQNVTDYSYQILTSLLIEKPLNREIKDTLGLDFRLTPYINTLNKPVTRLTLSKTLFERWGISFSRTIEESAQSDVRFKYDINPKMSLTALWENKRQFDLEELEEDRLGFNFEFNFDF